LKNSSYSFISYRTSSKDEEQRSSNVESTTHIRDPFILQSHSKNQLTPSSSTSEKTWQSCVQQQYHHSRPAHPTGSITQGNPIPSIDQPHSSQNINKSTQLLFF
jgi:hypothetical protein